VGEKSSYTLGNCMNDSTNLILLLMMCLFLQKKGLLRRGKGFCISINFNVPEVKMLLLLSYFVIAGVLSLAFFTFRVTEFDQHFKDLSRYFSCNRYGYSPQCEELRDDFETHLKPELYLTSLFILALLVWVHLLFAIQVQDIRKVIQRKRTTTWGMHWCTLLYSILLFMYRCSSEKNKKEEVFLFVSLLVTLQTATELILMWNTDMF